MPFDYCRAQADAAAGNVVPMDFSMQDKSKAIARVIGYCTRYCFLKLAYL